MFRVGCWNPCKSVNSWYFEYHSTLWSILRFIVLVSFTLLLTVNRKPNSFSTWICGFDYHAHFIFFLFQILSLSIRTKWTGIQNTYFEHKFKYISISDWWNVTLNLKGKRNRNGHWQLFCLILMSNRMNNVWKQDITLLDLSLSLTVRVLIFAFRNR